jgi:uncharacterized protein YecE (DUF72 family)
MLEYRAQRLGTVGDQHTSTDAQQAVAGWDAATPAEFTFAPAPQRITHIARLKDVDDPLRLFLSDGAQQRSKSGRSCSSWPNPKWIWTG